MSAQVPLNAFAQAARYSRSADVDVADFDAEQQNDEPRCANGCDSTIPRRVARVVGDNHNVVAGCPECVESVDGKPIENHVTAALIAVRERREVL